MILKSPLMKKKHTSTDESEELIEESEPAEKITPILPTKRKYNSTYDSKEWPRDAKEIIATFDYEVVDYVQLGKK
jgi:hypothetical protein